MEVCPCGFAPRLGKAINRTLAVVEHGLPLRLRHDHDPWRKRYRVGETCGQMGGHHRFAGLFRTRDDGDVSQRNQLGDRPPH